MFDQILSLVKEHAGSSIIDNKDIPNEQNDAAVETATHSIMDTLKDAVQSGNMSDVMGLFNSGGSNVGSNPLAQNMQGNLVERLMQKFGLSNSQAGGIASSLIPSVLGKLVHKTNDPNDSSFDLSSILSHFGGSNFDVGSVLSKFGLGGGSNNSQGGGIMDSLKNMLGK
ncbi:MAG: DUF937 domain-containing protein [Bacteroidetes bacterium]|nr:DUF937 domain-containing protein [Bacteroidota bacterium]